MGNGGWQDFEFVQGCVDFWFSTISNFRSLMNVKVCLSAVLKQLRPLNREACMLKVAPPQGKSHSIIVRET